jgi:hypothetical protein
MSTVGDIGVNVWAKGDGAVDEFHRVGKEAHTTFTGMVGEVEGFAHKMHETLGVLRQFKPITELGFGFGIGRQAFEQLHEGIVKVAEGFAEGLQHGETFFEALGDGASRVMGMKTSFEQAAEAAKKYSEQVEILAHAREAIDKISGNKEDLPFSNLSAADNDGYKKQLAELTKARDDAAKDFTAKSKEYDEKKAKNENRDQHPYNAFEYGTTKEQVGEAESAKRAAEALYKRFDDQIKTLGSSYGDANKNKGLKDEMADFDKEAAEQAKKAKEKAAHHMEQVYHAMAEAAKKGAEKAKQEAKHFEELARQFSPQQAAIDKLKDLEKVKDKISAEDYNREKRKIAEDYAAKSKQDTFSRADAGKAEEYGTVEAFKAVEESRQAMAAMGDKNIDLLEAQKDLQAEMAASLKTLVAKPGQQIAVADIF